MRIVKFEPEHQTKAKRLTQKWYKTLINTYDVVCISFYCQWCPGSGEGNYGPEYDKAASIIEHLYPRERHTKGKAIMVKVNCSDEKVLAKICNVWCYPSYKIVKNGEILEDQLYPPWRNTENFLQLIENHIDPKERKPRQPVPDRSIRRFIICTKEETLEHFKSYVKGIDLVFVFFYTSCQSCRDALEKWEIAYSKISKIYHTKLSPYTMYNRSKQSEVEFIRMEAGLHEAVIKKFKIRKYPTFRLVKYGDLEPEFRWDGTVESFVNYIKMHIEKDRKGKLKKAKEINEEEY